MSYLNLHKSFVMLFDINTFVSKYIVYLKHGIFQYKKIF